MFFFKENRKNSFRKENNDNLDPFFDYKKKARHRLVGSIIFAILILFLGNFFFKETPNLLVKEVTLEISKESLMQEETIKEFKRLLYLMGRNITEEDINALKKIEKKRWILETEFVSIKEKINGLREKLTKEGHKPALKMKKIGDIRVYYLVLGPYDQLTAEKLRIQFITRGIKVDINRL